MPNQSRLAALVAAQAIILEHLEPKMSNEAWKVLSDAFNYLQREFNASLRVCEA